ncbi:MAG: DUF222 domain-containing protein [Actinomycetales bacterium]|nr:DUF222 domain-containing protein [Actinomycetales bacterium]
MEDLLASDTTDLDDAAVVDLIAAAHRLTSWATACHLNAIAHLTRRWSEAARPAPGRNGLDTETAADLAHRAVVAETALACGMSEYAAQARTQAAVELTTRLRDTHRALSTGALDWPRVQAITNATAYLDDTTATAVEGAVLPEAPTQNVPALRRCLARAVLAADPTTAAQRHDLHRADRRVTYTPLPEGMGEIWAYLTAPDMLTVKTCLDHLTPTAPGDDRTRDQRRADTFVEVFLRAASPPAPVTSPGPDSAPVTSPGPDSAPVSGPGRTPDPVPVPVAVPGAAALDTRPPAPGSPSTSSPGTGSPSTSSPDTGSAPADTATGDSDNARGSRPDKARTDEDRADKDRTSEDRTGNCRTGANRTDDARALRRTPSRPQIVVTIPLAALTHPDQPALADLSDYGALPITAVTDLLTRGTWRCAAVDDHQTLLGLGTTTFTPSYRPNSPTRRHLTLRDRTCTFPGCHQPAHHCDLDHSTPYPHGPTCECNLITLCRHHHRLKHLARFHVRPAPPGEHPPGTLEWTTPTGHRYHRPPTPLTPPTTAAPGYAPTAAAPGYAPTAAAPGYAPTAAAPGDTPTMPTTMARSTTGIAGARGRADPSRPLPTDGDDPPPF